MSYEKVSGIKLNAKNNKIYIKSHSNNDDATPSYWEYISRDMSFNEKLENLFLDFIEGNLQSSSLSGSLLKVRYAVHMFLKDIKDDIGLNPLDDNSLEYKEMCEKLGEFEAKRRAIVHNNIDKFVKYLNEKDSEKKYVILWNGYYPIITMGRYGSFRYLCGRSKSAEKHFTNKQRVIITSIMDNCNRKYTIECI